MRRGEEESTSRWSVAEAVRRAGRWAARVLALAAVTWSPMAVTAQEPADPFGDELEAIAAEEEAVEATAEAERAAERALAEALAEAPVTDSTTDLQWTSEVRVLEGAFFVARSHCFNLVAGSQSDWRLPEVEELRAVVGRLDELGIRGEAGKLASGEIKEKSVSSIGVNSGNFQPNEELFMYVFVPKGKIRQTSVENRLDKKDIGVLCVRP